MYFGSAASSPSLRRSLIRWVRVGQGVLPQRHKLLHCPVCGVLRRARAEAVYFSASCRAKVWRQRKSVATKAQVRAEAESKDRALRTP